jgi:CheY-like chemotaxis protein
MKADDAPLQILLVEDNPVDVLITRAALKMWDVQNDLHVVEDGQKAVDYLFRRGMYDQVKQPQLLLLDLNLPQKNGIEVLSEIKQDAALSRITVVVVTTSGSDNELQMCHELGVGLVITKPLDFDTYVEEIKAVQRIWLDSKTG